jgi:Sugar phosphate isomerases/epimerases
MSIGLSPYSFPWRSGHVGRGSSRVCSQPLTAYDLLDLAVTYGLKSVELPLPMLPDLEPATLAAYKARADELGISLICDSGVIDVPTLEKQIPAAAALGAPILRVLVSGILEGARASVPGGWEAHLSMMIERLKQLRPLAEEYNVIIAPENHQDLTSADLIRICDSVGGKHIGVTLDAVNPLAVGEEPLAFAKALGHRIVNVHLKDYWIYPSEEGYRLVRCALGEGVLDVPGLFALLAETAPHATYHIELAALFARHIRIYSEAWWEGFPPTDIRSLLGLFRFMAQQAAPSDPDWRTPWERDAEPDELAAYENSQFERSVAYLKQLNKL